MIEMIKKNLERKSGCEDFDLYGSDDGICITFNADGFYANKEQEVHFLTQLHHDKDMDKCSDLYIRTEQNKDHGDVLITLDISQMKLLREYLDLRIKQIERIEG